MSNRHWDKQQGSPPQQLILWKAVCPTWTYCHGDVSQTFKRSFFFFFSNLEKLELVFDTWFICHMGQMWGPDRTPSPHPSSCSSVIPFIGALGSVVVPLHLRTSWGLLLNVMPRAPWRQTIPNHDCCSCATVPVLPPPGISHWTPAPSKGIVSLIVIFHSLFLMFMSYSERQLEVTTVTLKTLISLSF